MSPQILFNQPLNSLSPLPPSDFTLLFTSLTRGVAAIVLRGGREPSPSSLPIFLVIRKKINALVAV